MTDQRSLLDQLAAANRLHAAFGGRSRGLLPHRVEGLSPRRATKTSFVRYINRWDLQKADPSAELSPPKKPIVLLDRKDGSVQYRKPISDGILEWNKAFEKAGFVNAIEVRQQPDEDALGSRRYQLQHLPLDHRQAGFAMGPSRVNPMTGQILDADIIFDADFVQFWKRRVRDVHAGELWRP